MLRIYLMGDLCLASGERLVRAQRLRGRQGRLALAYLVSERGRPVARDELIDLLWPERTPAAFEVALSALLSKLRALFADAGLSRGALPSVAHSYQLRLPAASWVDTEASVRAVHDAEAWLRSGSPRKAYGHAVVARAILRRPFLPGDDGKWIERKRHELLGIRLRALDCLAEIHSWNREPTLALRAAEEAVELEPYRETGYRRLMQIHERAGNRGEALRVYEQLRRLLATELQTRPAPETEALLARFVGESS
jgi:DNA-binding SARP family transcriptional activator